jgi:hypothetical protein
LNIDAMTRPARVYEVGLRNIFSAVVCVFLIAVETPSFATDTDRAAAAVQRREGVTIGGGDGSSFDKAIIVHADNVPKEFLAGYEYIVLRYRWFQISSGSIVHYNGKSYHVGTFEDVRAMGFPKTKRVFYFDVSEYAPTYSLPPAYPREARDKGLTGKGVAVVKIDPRNGYVTTASILKSTGQEILDTGKSLEDRLRGNALVPYL